MFRRLMIGIVITMFAMSSMVGCGQQGNTTEDLTKVRLVEVVHSIFYAPQYVAINQGFFEEEGLDIELTTAQGSDKVITALLSGTGDIGLGGSEAPIYVYQQGQEDYVMNFAQLTQCDGSFLVGRQPDSDFRWENVRGKTIIGGRPGGMPEMVLEYILKKHGLTPGEDVEIITNLQFTATAGAFKGGTGDYVALFEPTATMLEKQGAGHVVASIGASSGEIPYTVYMARKSKLEEDPGMIQHFTNGLYEGQIWVEQHSPEEIAREIAPFFPDADMDGLTQVVARYKAQDTWSSNPVMSEQAFVYAQDIIQTAGELEETVEPDILINHRFAKKAVLLYEDI
ncbi:MAG: ABC transporter substrate-binding protein [Bacillota bacterium]|nr:ABC transporter substrate-binding protein [Bacillota bacterium]